MKITHQENITDPVHPIMHGTTPMSKEFNKRQAILWSEGKFEKFDFQQVSTVILEILIDDYNKRNAPPKKNKK